MFERLNQRMHTRSAALLLTLDTRLDRILQAWLLLAGLTAVDAVMADGALAAYAFAHAARADLLRRLGRDEEALAAYRQALALTEQEPERRFLRRRIAERGG